MLADVDEFTVSIRIRSEALGFKSLTERSAIDFDVATHAVFPQRQ